MVTAGNTASKNWFNISVQCQQAEAVSRLRSRSERIIGLPVWMSLSLSFLYFIIFLIDKLIYYALDSVDIPPVEAVSVLQREID